MTTSLGSINLLKWLAKLREMFDLLDYSQMEDMYRARCEEGVHSSHAFSGHANLPKSPRAHQPRSCSNPILEGIVWRLYHTGTIDQESHFQLLSFLKKMELKWRYQVSNHGLVFLMISLYPGHPRAHPELSHETQGITRISVSLSQEKKSKTKTKSKTRGVASVPVT